MSAVKIITADTYDDDGYPIDMGLMDLHLGVIEPNLRCRTCGGRVNDCPGHFGIIELAMPVIHVGYAKEIKHLLQSTCRACGRLLPDAPPSRPEAVYDSEDGPSARPREPKEERSCPFCHEVQQRIMLDKPTTFRENGHKIHPQGGPGPAGADPRLRPSVPRTQPEVRPPGMDGPDRPSGPPRPRSARRSPSRAGSGAKTI